MDTLSHKEQQRRAEQRRQSLALTDSRLAYTVDEFCRASGVGRSKLYEEHKAGRIKFRKLGKRSLITHDDGIAYLNALPEA